MADQVEKHNECHLDANWRGVCEKEIKTARVFENNWGFLCDKESANKKLEKMRAQPSSLVKYQDAKGGASVQRKRVPEMGRTVADNDVQGVPDPESARGKVALTHTLKMQAIPPIPLHRTTGREYGSRGTLEQFGIPGTSAIPRIGMVDVRNIESTMMAASAQNTVEVVAKEPTALEALQAKWEATNKVYQGQPIACDTAGKRVRKENLERDLAALEKQIKALS